MPKPNANPVEEDDDDYGVIEEEDEQDGEKIAETDNSANPQPLKFADVSSLLFILQLHGSSIFFISKFHIFIVTHHALEHFSHIYFFANCEPQLIMDFSVPMMLLKL